MKTVSNVIHDYPHVSTRTRERVQRAIDELGYRPNALGRRLATGRTGLIALAFADVGHPLLLGARARRQHCGVRARVPAPARAHGRDPRGRTRRRLQQRGGTGGRRDLPAVGHVLQRDRTAPRRRPLVLLGEGAAPLSVDHVMIDNLECRNGSDTAPPRPGPDADRVRRPRGGRAVRDVEAATHGLPGGLEQAGPAGRHVAARRQPAISAQTRPRPWAPRSTAVRFDGLVCRDDLAAIGSLRALAERGSSVPATWRSPGGTTSRWRPTPIRRSRPSPPTPPRSPTGARSARRSASAASRAWGATAWWTTRSSCGGADPPRPMTARATPPPP